MVSFSFGICLLISVGIFIYMAQKNYVNIDIYYWTIVTLIPVVLMSYWLKTGVETEEGASFLFCFIYLESSFLLAVMIFSMMRTLGFEVRPWAKIVVYGVCTVYMSIVALCVHTDLYYKTIRIIDTGVGHATKMDSGPLKITHWIFLGAGFVWMLAVLIMAIARNGTYSRRTLAIYMFLIAAGVLIHVYEIAVDVDFSKLPYLYVLGDLIIALDYDYEHTHDISCLISEQQKYHGTRGYAAIGLNRQFLSCNIKCFDFLPFLREQRVDDQLNEEDELGKKLHMIITAFEDAGISSEKFKVGDMTLACDISYFSIRKDGRIQGYLLDIRDATEEQKNLDIISSYNETLNAKVKEKTENIRTIQNKIVLGMANIIENRDNNTGGHVKRTSDIIKIIVDELRRQGNIPVSAEMAQDIVRAAPTHDLGKVSIDSSILLKPGRFTDEEYEIMKSHSVKSGEMVKILLEGVEEERFVEIAYNVARFHHERWDGRGYPEGLVGTMIPLEARIMAVADVYDALVSKRVYKEPMSFEKSASIMLEGMGTQFDPNMKAVFLGCRNKLEEYYRANG